MLITALNTNGVATDTTVVSVPGAPTTLGVAPVLHAVPVICTDAEHRAVPSANASWLYEHKTIGMQDETGNRTFAPKRHSQRERPT